MSWSSVPHSRRVITVPTTFHPAQQANLGPVNPSNDPRSLRVVICDDHPAFAKGLAKLFELEASGITVTGIAPTLIDAQKMIDESLPDVVLMDINLPDGDGVEMAKDIIVRHPGMKVSMLTASDSPSDARRALRAGILGYVMKDRDVFEIADAVRSVHRGNVVVPASLAADLMRPEEGKAELTDVERQILVGIARGDTNKDLGTRLHLSERTVRRRIADLYQKLQLSDRLEAALYATKEGLDR